MKSGLTAVIKEPHTASAWVPAAVFLSVGAKAVLTVCASQHSG